MLSWVPMYCSGLPGMFSFLFRQMLKQFFLHVSVIHIVFDLAPLLETQATAFQDIPSIGSG